MHLVMLFRGYLNSQALQLKWVSIWGEDLPINSIIKILRRMKCLSVWIIIPQLFSHHYNIVVVGYLKNKLLKSMVERKLQCSIPNIYLWRKLCWKNIQRKVKTIKLKFMRKQWLINKPIKF